MKDKRRLFIKTGELTESQEGVLRTLGVSDSSFKERYSDDCYIFPGLADVHVHLREPGFCYKETIATGSRAAAAGGFTHIMSMPNLNPVPDNMANLKAQQDAILKDGLVHIYPYGAITVGEKGEILADMVGMVNDVIAFTDDGRGVMRDELMEKAMKICKEHDKLIVAHCEDENYPRESSEAEYRQLERDLNLVKSTGCRYHMCHVSAKESIALLRQAKQEGIDVTAETAPHYLVHSRNSIEDHGKFKMNPPIKREADRLALIEAVSDGTIDMIATDHAPHSREEKEGGFAKAAYGIVGLETALPVMNEYLVSTGILTLDTLIRLMYVNPMERFGLKAPGIDEILASPRPDFAIWKLDEEYKVNPENFLSKGRYTPFDGMKVRGRCLMTICDGKIVTGDTSI